MSLFPRIFAILLMVSTSAFAGERVYQKPSDFLKSVFGSRLPSTQAVTLDSNDQSRIKKLLGHPYRTSKVRYWSNGKKTAWILEEIGKTEPITTGYVVERNQITQVKVLIYREGYGYEVAGAGFCKQFKGATLDSNGRLTKQIRNIAGATLSVRALDRLGRVALYLESTK